MVGTVLSRVLLCTVLLALLCVIASVLLSSTRLHREEREWRNISISSPIASHADSEQHTTKTLRCCKHKQSQTHRALAHKNTPVSSKIQREAGNYSTENAPVLQSTVCRLAQRPVFHGEPASTPTPDATPVATKTPTQATTTQRCARLASIFHV